MLNYKKIKYQRWVIESDAGPKIAAFFVSSVNAKNQALTGILYQQWFTRSSLFLPPWLVDGAQIRVNLSISQKKPVSSISWSKRYLKLDQLSF